MNEDDVDVVGAPRPGLRRDFDDARLELPAGHLRHGLTDRILIAATSDDDNGCWFCGSRAST